MKAAGRGGFNKCRKGLIFVHFASCSGKFNMQEKRVLGYLGFSYRF